MPDQAVTRFLRSRWGGPLDGPAIAFSHVGRGGLAWLLAETVVRQRSGERVRPSRAVVGSVALAYGGSLLLARMIGRPRPCDGNGTALIECPNGPGLPSDQAAGAFAAAAAVRLRHRRAGIGLYVAATGVAAGRVYCGVHHLSDVVAGAALGVIAARLAASTGCLE